MGMSAVSEDYPERREQVRRGIPLVVVLHGFSDAGGAVSQLEQFFLEHHSPETLMIFNNDAFLDYRARRPTVTFVNDRLVDYRPASLVLEVAKDLLGNEFLLLRGYEPDFQWDLFLTTVRELVDEFDVSVTTWVHAIPMPVPHTRPIGTTVSGNDEELIASRSIWKPTTKLSASIGHALEYQLFTDEKKVVGFVLLVPHYLANTEYPQALITSLESIMSATGLLFSTGELLDREREFREQVDEQVRSNHESMDMLANLEQRYDEYVADDGAVASPLVEDEGDLPTADQIATQFETFLAQHWGEAPEGTKEEEHDSPSDLPEPPDS